MVFGCLRFPPNNERKQVDLRYHGSKVEFFRSFFGGNRRHQKPFQNYLTFRAKIQIRVNLNFGSIVRGRAVVFLRHFRELFRQTAAWCSTVLKETFIIIFDTIINNEPKLGLMQCIKKGNIIESSSRNVFLKFQMGL